MRGSKVELRRIQRTAGGTFFVCLPKGWAERRGLDRGSIVAVNETADGRLIVDPMYEVKRAHKAVSVKPGPYLGQEIVGSYLLGYDIIRVEARDRIKPEDRERAKRAASRLIGLEVVEEDVSRVTLQCLLEPLSFPPEGILKRGYSIAAGMHKDAVAALVEGDVRLAEEVIVRDDDVDRLYFLLTRILRTILQDPRLGDKLGVRPLDCLDYRLAGSLVESIGDQSARVAFEAVKLGGIKLPKDVSGLLLNLHIIAYEAHETAIKALFMRDIPTAESVRKMHDKVYGLASEINRALGPQFESVAPHVNIAVLSMSRIYEHSVDIADLAAPKLPA